MKKITEMKKRKLFIAVEGNIGSGKSDIIDHLNKVGFITEQQDVKKMNELLKKYYENSTKKGECSKLQQLVFDMYKDQCVKHDLLLGDKKEKVHKINSILKGQTIENYGKISGRNIKLEDYNPKFETDVKQLKLYGADDQAIDHAKKLDELLFNQFKNMTLDEKKLF